MSMDFLDTGMNQWERKLLVDYQQANAARIIMATLDGALTSLQAVNTSSSGGFLGTGASAGYASAGIIALVAGLKANVATGASIIEANMQEHALRASIEQRRQEWTLQLGLAQQDVAIGAQQVQLAQDHQSIVGQERNIAGCSRPMPRPRSNSWPASSPTPTSMTG